MHGSCQGYRGTGRAVQPRPSGKSVRRKSTASLRYKTICNLPPALAVTVKLGLI